MSFNTGKRLVGGVTLTDPESYDLEDGVVVEVIPSTSSSYTITAEDGYVTPEITSNYGSPETFPFFFSGVPGRIRPKITCTSGTVSILKWE